MEKNINKKKTPASPKKRSSRVTKKEETSLLESNKIEDSIINETPIVYNTPKCTVPSSDILGIKSFTESLRDKIVNFIKLLLTYK
jgi:hypothetical protein